MGEILATQGRMWSGAAIALTSLLLGVTSVFAGGGLPDVSFQFAPGAVPTEAAASGDFSNQSGNYTSTSSANASAQGGPNREVHVATGHDTEVRDLKGGISISSDTTAVVFQKGDNLIAKSRTETITKITVNGQTYTVADEVAMAAARATQFGSSAAASVESNLGGPGSGYFSTSVVTGKVGGAR